VIIFIIAAAATFAFILMRQTAQNGQPTSFFSAFRGETGLDLRVEGQGDRVLLSWNRRNPAVRNARRGVLHIRDGTRDRNVRLDADQVRGGAVLYRPGSGDVTFRLDVESSDGTLATDSTRVLDGARPAR
jgi:hypothetical protein